MERTVVRHNWWVYLLRGIFSLIIGVLALMLPVVTFTTLVILFGAYMLAGGILSVIAALRERRAVRHWKWFVFYGIVSIVAGLLVFYNPFAAGVALVYVFAFWALMVGIVEILAAIRLRRQIEGEGWFIFWGILTILFAVLILINPLVGAFTLALMFGVYTLASGIMLIFLSLRLRDRQHRIDDLHHGHGAVA